MSPALTPGAALAGPTTWSPTLLAAWPEPEGGLAAVQRRGREALGAWPIPRRSQEDWRFTNLQPLTLVDPVRLVPSRETSDRWPAPSAGTLRLILDGLNDPLEGLALPAGLEVLSDPDRDRLLGHGLAATGTREHWPVLLNKALVTRVLALRVRGSVEGVLEVVSDAGQLPGVLPVRILLVLEEGASLEVLQVHRSSGPNLTSVAFEALVGSQASLRIGFLAEGSDTSCLMAHWAISQDQGSDLQITGISEGWGLARQEPSVVQSAGGARTCLRGLQVVGGHQIADTHSQVSFGGPEGVLDQLHKTVADGAGRSVFSGAVRVPREAQRTNAAQKSQTLLLSNRARIDTKPELEIVADDVKCAHGATVSRLEEKELFYLRSRGIAAHEAARLLLRGFCDQVLKELPSSASAWQPLQTMAASSESRSNQGITP